MAQHETYSLGIDTNFDSVLKANKAINAMYEGLKKVDRGFSGMHAPRGLPAEINHMSAVTASYGVLHVCVGDPVIEVSC